MRRVRGLSSRRLLGLRFARGEVQPGFGEDFEPVAVVESADEDLAAEGFAEGFGGDDPGGGALGDEASVFHEEDARGAWGEFLDVVGDHEDGWGLGVGEDGFDGGEDVFAAGDVEAGGGFVEDEQFGEVDEGAGDEGASLLAGGEQGEPVVESVAESDESEQVACALALVGGGGVVEADGVEEAGEDGVGGGEVGVDRGAGDVGAGGVGRRVDHADAFAEGADVGAADRFAQDVERAGGGEELAGEGSGEGGFSAAVGAEDGDAFAGGDGAGEAVEDGGLVADDAEVAGVDGGGDHGWGRVRHGGAGMVSWSGLGSTPGISERRDAGASRRQV